MTRAEYQAKYGVQPGSTSTASTQTTPVKMTRAEYQAKYGAVPPLASTTQEPQQEGLLKVLAKSIVSPIATLAARPVQLGAEVLGASAEDVNKATKKIAGDWVAPVPQTGADVMKDVGRGFETVSLGVGGALPKLGAGALGKTALGKAVQTVAKPLATAPGAIPVAKGAIDERSLAQLAKEGAGIGAKGGTTFGAGQGMEQTGDLSQAIPGAVTGGLAGLAGGVAVPLALRGATKITGVAKEPSRILPKPENIMNRVARLTPTDAAKFKKMTGESHGSYLSKTGNFNSPEDIVSNEYNKFVSSKNSVDDTFSKLPGTYKDSSVGQAITELTTREKRIGFSGGDSARINELATKYKKSGLSMSEINEVKRLFEKNVKLDFLKGNVPEGIEKSNRIDNAIRTWQFDKAEKLGFKNLKEMNKQTQASKFIVDSLGKQLTGRSGNEAISITDWIMLSGGDTTAIAGLAAKKLFGNKKFQAGIANILTPSSKIEGMIKPIYDATRSTRATPQLPKKVSEKALPKVSPTTPKKSMPVKPSKLK